MTEDTGEELYSYAYEECPSIIEDVYYVSNDEILQLRRDMKSRGNKSIKGSRSMEYLALNQSQ